MKVAARTEMNGLQPLTLSATVKEDRSAEHGRDSTEEQNLNRNSEYVEESVPVDLPGAGYAYAQYHPSMIMASAELLDDIGILLISFWIWGLEIRY